MKINTQIMEIDFHGGNLSREKTDVKRNLGKFQALRCGRREDVVMVFLFGSSLKGIRGEGDIDVAVYFYTTSIYLAI